MLELKRVMDSLEYWNGPAIVSPLECSACPYAVPGLDINPDDPAEGYYECNLLGQTDIWGEQPICTSLDWQNLFIKLWKDLEDELAMA